MNEEIDAAMKRVQQALEAFEESKTFETALELEWKLTHLKLFLTPDVFDQLPALSRALREASDFIDKLSKSKEEAK